MPYAYSNIKKSSGSALGGEAPEFIRPGDSVSQKDLGVTDEEWQEMYRDGIVGDEKLPEDLQPQESLFQYRARKATEQYESAMSQAVAGSPPAGVNPQAAAKETK